MTDTVNFGRTPGYWKNHTENWTYLDPKVTLDTTVEGLFGVDIPGIDGSYTLLSALNAGGGGVNALLRQAGAAYLNASVNTDGFPGIPKDNYLLWQSDVQDAVKYVFNDSSVSASEVEKLKNIFEYFNASENGQLKLDTAVNNPGDPFFKDIFDDLAAAAGTTAGNGPGQYGWDDFLALSGPQQFAIINDYLL